MLASWASFRRILGILFGLLERCEEIVGRHGNVFVMLRFCMVFVFCVVTWRAHVTLLRDVVILLRIATSCASFGDLSCIGFHVVCRV